VKGLQLALYLLCVVTSFGCTALLYREYRRRHLRLLLWSALCFVCLTVNNLLLFVDLAVFPEFDLRLPRLLSGFAGMAFLLYGFVWEAKS